MAARWFPLARFQGTLRIFVAFTVMVVKFEVWIRSSVAFVDSEGSFNNTVLSTTKMCSVT